MNRIPFRDMVYSAGKRDVKKRKILRRINGGISRADRVSMIFLFDLRRKGNYARRGTEFMPGPAVFKLQFGLTDKGLENAICDRHIGF